MKLKKILNAFLPVAILMMAAPFANAIPVKTSPQREVVEEIISKAKALDNKSEFALNSKAIESKVDFARLTKDSLGENLSRVSTTQRNEIQDLLRRIITKTVYPEAPKFFKDVSIGFTAEDKTEQGSHITSVVTKGTRRSTVEFWVSAESKIIDLAIDGESWVQNLRSQFDEIISRKGTKDLIMRMKRRARELSESPRG